MYFRKVVTYCTVGCGFLISMNIYIFLVGVQMVLKLIVVLVS